MRTPKRQHGDMMFTQLKHTARKRQAAWRERDGGRHEERDGGQALDCHNKSGQNMSNCYIIMFAKKRNSASSFIKSEMKRKT